MNLSYLQFSSVLLAAFRSNFLHSLVVDWSQVSENAVPYKLFYCNMKNTDYRTDTTYGGSNLQVAGCRSRVAACRSQVAGCRSQVAGRGLQVAGRGLQVAGRRSQVAGCRLNN